MKYRYVIIAVIIFIFIGCDVINPDEKIPAFLRIDEVSLDGTAYFNQDSENISDVWVFVNSSLIGAYELPADIPILEDGETSIRVIPGIYKDGIQAVHHFYPYYSRWDTTVNFVANETVTLIPEFEYLDNFEIVFNEDFESSTVDFKASDQSDAVLDQSENYLIDGLKSGVMVASASDSILEIVSKNTFQVTNRSTSTFPTYMEIDYRSSVQFKVGVYANGTESFELMLRPNTERTKIYVDLSKEIGVFSESAEYQVFFKADTIEANDYMSLDNIRLLKHLQ